MKYKYWHLKHMSCNYHYMDYKTRILDYKFQCLLHKIKCKYFQTDQISYSSHMKYKYQYLYDRMFYKTYHKDSNFYLF